VIVIGVEHGAPDLVAAVESGAVSVSAASDLATLTGALSKDINSDVSGKHRP
jgi:hypothetical protein